MIRYVDAGAVAGRGCARSARATSEMAMPSSTAGTIELRLCMAAMYHDVPGRPFVSRYNHAFHSRRNGMHVRAFVVATGMVAVAALPLAARERADDDGINAKNRQEGMTHSQNMRTLH